MIYHDHITNLNFNTTLAKSYLLLRLYLGQYAPIHVPEGVAPAQGILQQTMIDIFEPLGDWLLVIFDNVLILAGSAQEAVDRFAIFLDRCNEYNVILKFDKTWIGFSQVKFFGYICEQH